MPGQRIGDYEVLSELGRGGMGAVLRARSPDGREVAVKVLLAPAKSGVLERFDRERRLQAVLGEAEGFVPLLDVGTSPRGPFLVMPLLPGGTLESRIARGAFDVATTIQIGRALAGAMGRAHAVGIVHRDLKPANVLFDASGRPLVADLGLAKHFDRTGEGGAASVALSKSRDLRGTFGYMAPEQARDARSAGPPADVFSLGAILYEMLAGTRCFEGNTAFEVAARAEKGVFKPLARARPETPAWLVAVVERALAPDLALRFPDAAALERALASPPAARAPSRIPALVGGLAALATLGAVAVVLARSDSSAPVPVAARSPAGPSPTPRALARTPTPTPALAEPLPPFARVWEPTKRMRLTRAVGSVAWKDPSGFLGALWVTPDGRVVTVDGQATVCVFDPVTGERRKRISTGWPKVYSFGLSPDGKLVFAVLLGGLAIVDLESGLELPNVSITPDVAEWQGATELAPDGSRVARASTDGSLHLYDARTGAPAGVVPSKIDTNHAFTFSRDGRTVLTLEHDGGVKAWTVATGASRELNQTSRPIAIADDGARALLRLPNDEVQIWDLTTGELSASQAVGQRPELAAFSPDGARVAVYDRAGKIWFVDAATGRATRSLATHAIEPRKLAFSPDSRRLFMTDSVLIRDWDLETGIEAPREPLDVPVTSIVFSPDGKLLAAIDDGTGACVWPVAGGKRVLHLLESDARACAFDARGERLLCASKKGGLWWCDVATGKLQEAVATDDVPWKCAAFAPDLRHVVSGYDIGMSFVKLWDIAKGEVVWRGSTPRGAEDLTADASLRYVVTRDADEHFTLFDTRAGENGKAIGGEKGFATSCCIHGTLGFLGFGDVDEHQRVECWDLGHARLLWGKDCSGFHVFSLATSPDGSIVAVANAARVLLLDAATGKELDVLDLLALGSGDLATCVAFADAHTLVVGTARGLLLTFELTGAR